MCTSACAVVHCRFCNTRVPLCEHLLVTATVPRLHVWWAEGSSVCGAGWWEGSQTSLIVSIARYWAPCWYCNEFCLVSLVSCTSWWHVCGQCYQYLWDNSCPSRACQMYGIQGFTLHNCSFILKVVMQCWTWMPYIQWAWECMYSVRYWDSSRWHIIDQETFAYKKFTC